MKIYKCDICSSTNSTKNLITPLWFGMNKVNKEKLGTLDTCQECYVPISNLIHELKKGGLE